MIPASPRRLLPALVLGLAAAVAAPAWAGEDAAIVNRAIRLYDSGAAKEASSLLDFVLRDAAETPQLRALAGLYLGLSRLKLGEAAGAREAFVAAFLLEPGMPLPSGSSADAAALAEGARVEARASLAKVAAPATPAPVPPAAVPQPPAVEPNPPPPVEPPPAPAPAVSEAAKPASATEDEHLEGGEPAPAAPKPAAPPAASQASEDEHLDAPASQPAVEAKKPAKASEGESFSLGLGTGYVVLPADKHWSPTLELLLGKDNVTTRFLARFGIDFGDKTAFSLGARVGFNSTPRPVSWGGGVDLGLVFQPSTPGDPPLLIEAKADLIQLGYELKVLRVELRALSLGMYLRPSDPAQVRFAVGGGLSVHWLPGRR